MPPHLKKSRNQAQPNWIMAHQQIVTHLETELDLNGSGTPDELQLKTVSHKTAKTIVDRPKLTCHHCKKLGHYRNQCRLLKRQKEQSEGTQNIPGNKNIGAINSIPNNNTNKISNNNNNYRNTNTAEGKQKGVHPPCETCGKTNHSTEKCYYGANAANGPPPRQRRPERQNQVQERGNQNDSNEATQAAAQN